MHTPALQQARHQVKRLVVGKIQDTPHHTTPLSWSTPRTSVPGTSAKSRISVTVAARMKSRPCAFTGGVWANPTIIQLDTGLGLIVVIDSSNPEHEGMQHEIG